MPRSISEAVLGKKGNGGGGVISPATAASAAETR